MSSKLLQATDVASGSFLLLLLASAAATVLLFIGTHSVAKKWKLPVLLAGLVSLVATLHYVVASSVWLEHGEITIIYRYIDWIVTQPLQVLALYFFVGTIRTPTIGLFWRLLVVSVVMVLTQYMGESGLMHPTLGFLLGLVAWLYVLGELFFGRLADINSDGGNEGVQRGYFWLRLIVSVGWSIYPITHFIASFAGGVEVSKLNIVFNLSDLVNQIAFGTAILTVAVKDSAYLR